MLYVRGGLNSTKCYGKKARGIHNLCIKTKTEFCSSLKSKNVFMY